MSHIPIPHELSIGDVYFSPDIPIVVISFFLTGITVLLMNRLKISRWFYAPSYIFLSIWILYILLIDKYFIRL